MSTALRSEHSYSPLCVVRIATSRGWGLFLTLKFSGSKVRLLKSVWNAHFSFELVFYQPETFSDSRCATIKLSTLHRERAMGSCRYSEKVTRLYHHSEFRFFDMAIRLKPGKFVLIRIEDVTKRYPGGHDALKGLSLHVDKGEMVFVTGRTCV